MRKTMIAGMALGVTAAVLAGAALAGGREPTGRQAPDAPAEAVDLGVGERLILVVGGAFPTAEEASAETARMRFGDLQGYYTASVGQFEGLDEVLGVDPSYTVLVSAFRTEQGAREFADLALAAGAPAMITPRLVNHGDVYVGLGQEADPDGSGPLQGPIPGVTIR